MTDLDDRRVIACNYAVGTKVCKRGARAYVTLTNPCGGHDRIQLLARSRGGRWVNKWENIRRLKDFRLTTIPPEHPLYRDERLRDDSGRTVAMLQRARAHFVDGADPHAMLRWERCGYECAESVDVGLHKPPIVRIHAVAEPKWILYYGLDDYLRLDDDDAAFVAIVESMLEMVKIGAFG